MQRVIISPVLELLSDAPADLETVLRRDRHVAGIEQLVDVGRKENAVASRMDLYIMEIADVHR